MEERFLGGVLDCRKESLLPGLRSFYGLYNTTSVNRGKRDGGEAGEEWREEGGGLTSDY